MRIDWTTEIFFVAVSRDEGTGASFFVGVAGFLKPDYFAEFALAVFLDADIAMSRPRLGDDGFVTGFGEEFLPEFGVKAPMRFASRPVASKLEDFPGAVASAVLDDKVALVGDECVVANRIVFFPVGKVWIVVGPGVSVEVIVDVLILLGLLARTGRFPIFARGVAVKCAVKAPE